MYLTRIILPFLGSIVSKFFGRIVGIASYLWFNFLVFVSYLKTMLNKVYNCLEWPLNSPPKPYGFSSSPMQSSLWKTLVFISLTVIAPLRIFFFIFNLPFLLPVIAGIQACLYRIFHICFTNGDFPSIRTFAPVFAWGFSLSLVVLIFIKPVMLIIFISIFGDLVIFNANAGGRGGASNNPLDAIHPAHWFIICWKLEINANMHLNSLLTQFPGGTFFISYRLALDNGPMPIFAGERSAVLAYCQTLNPNENIDRIVTRTLSSTMDRSSRLETMKRYK